MTAKKTAAKKAASKATEPVQAVTEEEGTASPDTLGEFPLPAGHYFYPPVVSRSAHSGSTTADRGALLSVQRLLGVAETGVYDDATEVAVREWKHDSGLADRSAMIDEDVWELLRKG